MGEDDGGGRGEGEGEREARRDARGGEDDEWIDEDEVYLATALDVEGNAEPEDKPEAAVGPGSLAGPACVSVGAAVVLVGTCTIHRLEERKSRKDHTQRNRQRLHCDCIPHTTIMTHDTHTRIHT